MSKQMLNENQYLEILNRELRNDPDYREGMKIIGVPQGSTGSDLSGYSWEGPKEVMPGLVSKIVSLSKKNYELRVTQR